MTNLFDDYFPSDSGDGLVLSGGNYYTKEDAEDIAEGCRIMQEAEEDYFNTYTAFDQHNGRDYTKDKTLQHPYPVAFKHFHETIGLDPEEAHLLACGERRFDLISDNLNDEKRVLAANFYCWLEEQEYWGLSELVEYEPGITLEPSVFGFLETEWGTDDSHPLYKKLKQY